MSCGCIQITLIQFIVEAEFINTDIKMKSKLFCCALLFLTYAAADEGKFVFIIKYFSTLKSKSHHHGILR